MTAEIRTFSYSNGELQRVQVAHLDSWKELAFHKPTPSHRAIDSFARIYRKFLVPACPALFGTMVMFSLPEDLEVPFSRQTKKYGHIADALTVAAAGLEKGLFFLGNRSVFRDDTTKQFYRALEARNCIRIVRGWLPITTIIPVGNLSGFLTESEETARLKVNANFFIMDRFDCATAYDHVGIPLGLCVKNGQVENPPAYNREALLVRNDDSLQIRSLDIRDLEIEIGGIRYQNGNNARIYQRPQHRTVRNSSRTKVVIRGRTVAAVSHGVSQLIPTSGFVLCIPENCDIRPGDPVTYHGLEDVTFGIQVGNSILRNGVKTERFISRFYNLRRFQPIPYPPSLYPMDFRNSRAARIALGADAEGKPMILWAEGAGKVRYTPGQDSCGASLSEMADICEAIGMVNAVNLDGGGSAQILRNNQRSLQISDRKDDRSECERPVPLALIVK